MFPTLNYLINYIFGTNITLNFPPSFGFMVAISFALAAWVLSSELKRKEALGLITGKKQKMMVGLPATPYELITNGLMGFVFGFKVGGILAGSELFRFNPQAYLLSWEGNLIGGLLGFALLAYWRYAEAKKKQLKQPREETVTIHPYQQVGSITIVAAISGILGAKIFHQFEYWDAFMRDPVGTFFSASGLTFYGGLIGGFLGVWWFCRRNKIPLIQIADALAPGLILAYAIGRLGCLLSGDGDWGIINSAYRISDDRTYTLVDSTLIHQDLAIYKGFTDTEDYKYIPKPEALSFLPNWMFAFDFPHNVNEEGIPMENCQGQYCRKLPLPVFPTMFYETIMGLIIFSILWFTRKRMKYAGQMFFAYLALNGLERFVIEQIRVNSTFNFLGMQITQAEMIASILMIIGIVGFLLCKKMEKYVVKL